MIAADARTIPWLWRGCSHVYDPEATHPRRCLACRAIDHGAGPAPRSASHNAGYVLGTCPYPMTLDDVPKVTITKCDKGHEMVATRYVRGDHEVKRHVCHVCRDERRAAKLLEPCDAGHVGERYYTGLTSIRGIKCRECETDRKRQNRATSITRSYAEASHA